MVTIEALRTLGRLEATDEALVAVCISTARALDAYPNRASLIDSYVAALDRLMVVGDGGTDDFAALIADLGRTSVVSETETGT